MLKDFNREKQKQIANKIEERYLTGQGKLTLFEAKHFVMRVYRISQNSDGIDTIKRYYKENKKSLIKAFSQFDKASIKRESEIILRRDYKNVHNDDLLSFYKERPEVLFNRYYINELFDIKSFGLEKEFLEVYEQAVNYFTDTDFSAYLFSEKNLELCGTFSVNIVWKLLYLGGEDYRKKFTNAWQNHYLNKSIESKEEYW